MLLQRNQTSGRNLALWIEDAIIGVNMDELGFMGFGFAVSVSSLREELMKNRMKDIKKVHGANIRGVVDEGGNLFSSNGKSLDSDLLMSQRS